MRTPADVAMLRRELAEWCAASGATSYLQMIMLGRQVICPPGSPQSAARILAAMETTRLREADLWYIDEGLCELLQHAHPTMPRFTPCEEDLPSRTGFAVFANPIDAREPRTDPQLLKFVEELDRAAGDTRLADSGLTSLPIEVSAVSWGPLPGSPSSRKAPAGGVWMTFYANSKLNSSQVDPEIARVASAGLPPMLADNEAVVPWCPPGGDPSAFELPQPGETGTTWGWAALVFAVFRLAAQAGIAGTTRERTARPERRRTQRAGLPERDVRVVRLRRSERGASGSGGSDREYQHRWIVRGHWRSQPWGTNREQRRPVWIAPYVKGPEGAPMMGGERVNVAGAPPGGGG
jgi:hypothetical protein